MPASAADLFSLIPPATVRQHRIVPVALQDGVLEVGVAGRPTAEVLRELAFLTGQAIRPVPTEAAEIDAWIDEHLPPLREQVADRPAAPSPAPVAPAGSVVHQVDGLIRRAIEQGASDIHLEPYEHDFRVRYRLDGVLHAVEALSLLQRDALISRLKIMASLDIAEKRRPQDGRIRYRHGDRTVDLRVSTLPTDCGEKVVLRILDKSSLNLNLEALGFSEQSLRCFRRAIHLPFGMVLVTGPTGSGKTTTLYAALNELNTPAVNITTIEDPIEYHLAGVNQTHVRSDIGLTFAQALRAFLRQDPNIIMVGEVRDAETARIAIRAALTGHLVLSTIHTNDAPSTITRLIDMGVEPFLVASSVRLVVAQRLVRRICSRCTEAVPPDPAWAEALGLTVQERIHRGRGCTHCNGTGYRGRMALFEVMPVDEPMAEMIARAASVYDLRRHARRQGMHVLREEALLRMRAGLTTPEEVLRETNAMAPTGP